MESVRSFLISKWQSQKTNCDRAHGIRQLDDLQPNQEVLFLSPAATHYIPGTILAKATIPCSYTIEAQGKRYHRTREHIRPIHLNIPVNTPHQWQTKPNAPKHNPNCISRPKPNLNLVWQPKNYLPKPTK